MEDAQSGRERVLTAEVGELKQQVDSLLHICDDRPRRSPSCSATSTASRST